MSRSFPYFMRVSGSATAFKFLTTPRCDYRIVNVDNGIPESSGSFYFDRGMSVGQQFTNDYNGFLPKREGNYRLEIINM